MQHNRCHFYLLILTVLLVPGSLKAQELSAGRQIEANYGNATPTGFPQIRIPLAKNTELSRLGFVFVMNHHAIPAHGGFARTEWRVPGLRTCVYLDGNEDLVWIRPNAQQLVFKKAGNYKEARLGWTAEILDNMRVVGFTNRAGQKWTYEKGFLREISDRFRTIDFVTDHEIILQAIRRGGAGDAAALIRAEYSDEGLLKRLKLGQSSSLAFHWSEKAMLLGIEGTPEGDMTFSYDNMLLREWTRNGTSTGYTWEDRGNTSKNISFGMAPVRLQSDAEYRYEYDKAGSVSIFRVFKHDGTFVSETRLSDRGIIQKTGDKTIKAIYRRNDAGRKLVIEPE